MAENKYKLLEHLGKVNEPILIKDAKHFEEVFGAEDRCELCNEGLPFLVEHHSVIFHADPASEEDKANGVLKGNVTTKNFCSITCKLAWQADLDGRQEQT